MTKKQAKPAKKPQKAPAKPPKAATGVEKSAGTQGGRPDKVQIAPEPRGGLGLGRGLSRLTTELDRTVDIVTEMRRRLQQDMTRSKQATESQMAKLASLARMIGTLTKEARQIDGLMAKQEITDDEAYETLLAGGWIPPGKEGERLLVAKGWKPPMGVK